jgi:glutamate synthase (NADPH/NADH) large chain
VGEGYTVIILSDRGVDAQRAPIPGLLACSAVHQHLVKTGLRTSCSLIIETGAARETHHFAVLAGYGAESIHPWMVFESLDALAPTLPGKPAAHDCHKRFIKAVGKGLMKIMSKMGISTYQSYCGAQIFEAIGLSSDFVARYFTGTPTKIEGIGLKEVALEALNTHAAAFGNDPVLANMLDVGGEYAFRVRGEDHVTNTAIQIQIAQALGYAVPQFAHIALLKGKEGKLSKRTGSASIRDLRADEVEPIAILSLLAKMGTSDPIELHSIDELVTGFDFKKFIICKKFSV